MTEFGRDHQRGAAAIVGRVDGRAGYEQHLDDIHGGTGAHALFAARSPHQRGQIVAVGTPGIDAGLEQAAHDEREPASGGIRHRRLAGRVHDIRIGAIGDELIDDATIAFERGRGERRDARWARQVWIGMSRQQNRNRRLPLVLSRGVKRGRADQIARVDGRALRQEKLDQRHVSRPRRPRQRHGAEPVARHERSARIEQAARQRHASGIGRREQHKIEPGGVGLRPDQVEPAFELAAGGSRGRPCRRGQNRLRWQAGDEDRTRQDNATYGIQRCHRLQDMVPSDRFMGGRRCPGDRRRSRRGQRRCLSPSRD